MPPPDPISRFHYRSRASAHVKAGREQLKADDRFGSIHACLHARLAIEALAYDLFQDYLFEVSAEAMASWTPKAVLNELLYIDSEACSPISVTIGFQSEDGARQEIDLGKNPRMRVAWANKIHNALGSFLHQPTVRQTMREPDADLLGLARQKAEEALDELERVLASPLWSFRAHRLVTFKCECGYSVSRDGDFLLAGKRVSCSNCGRLYGYQFDEERERFQFRAQRASWACPDCKTVHAIDAYEVKPGAFVECSGCSQKFEFSTKTVLTRVLPAETASNDTP
jgi:hypothetical protein